MASINAADTSKFLHQRGQGIHAAQVKSGKASSKETSKETGTSPPGSDQLDLSTNTAQVLENFEQRIDSLLQKYPNFSHLIREPSSPTTPLHTFSQAKALITSPQMQNHARANPSFSQFFSQVSDLLSSNEEMLQKSQLQPPIQTTYKNLVKLIN